MTISKAGLDLICEFEGYHKARDDGSCEAYQTVLGYKNGKPVLDIPTIGFGCTEGVKMGMVWTRAQADDVLRRELAKHEAIVASLVKVPITQHQYDALVSFNYNCGKLHSSTLLKRINAGDVDGAANEFANWTKAQGIVMKGLVRRRAAEKALFLKPDDDAPSPQAVDAPKAELPRSGTVWGTIAGAGAGVMAYLDQTVAALLEWSAKLTELSPVQTALAGMGGNVKSMTLGLGIGAAVYVVSRRVKAAQEGKPG